MEVKIGVQHSPRELVVETRTDSDEIERQFSQALADGGILSIIDTRGRRVVVPADKVAYLDFGSSAAGTVGFR